MPTIDDLIDSAIGQKPTQFASFFDQIMGDKTAEAIDAMRTSVAQGIYASEEDLDDQIDDEDTINDDDGIGYDEYDDDDDLDLDDEDLDFDEEDLEGLDDDGEDA